MIKGLHQKQPGVRTWDGEPDSPSAVNSSSIAAIQCVAELMLKAWVAKHQQRRNPQRICQPCVSSDTYTLDPAKGAGVRLGFAPRDKSLGAQSADVRGSWSRRIARTG